MEQYCECKDYLGLLKMNYVLQNGVKLIIYLLSDIFLFNATNNHLPQQPWLAIIVQLISVFT